jgi:hypothetical protein
LDHLARLAAPLGRVGAVEAAYNLLSHQVLLLMPDGQMMRRTASAGGVAMVQKYGQKIPTGYAMVYRDGDNNYLLTNQKLPDGSMLFDHRDAWYERN